MNAEEARTITNEVISKNPDIPKILEEIFLKIESAAEKGQQHTIFDNPSGQAVKDAITKQLQGRGFNIAPAGHDMTMVYW